MKPGAHEAGENDLQPYPFAQASAFDALPFPLPFPIYTSSSSMMRKEMTGRLSVGGRGGGAGDCRFLRALPDWLYVRLWPGRRADDEADGSGRGVDGRGDGVGIVAGDDDAKVVGGGETR
jgi:hypothetical protein